MLQVLPPPGGLPGSTHRPVSHSPFQINTFFKKLAVLGREVVFSVTFSSVRLSFISKILYVIH